MVVETCSYRHAGTKLFGVWYTGEVLDMENTEFNLIHIFLLLSKIETNNVLANVRLLMPGTYLSNRNGDVDHPYRVARQR